jgi:bifunctional non-homologous end joining protein LigD
MEDTPRFVIHRHKTATSHFDLRLLMGEQLRCWSILRDPVCLPGEKRLAIERENVPVQNLNKRTFTEEAFGTGKVYVWDEGPFKITAQAAEYIVLEFRGKKLSGRYELRRMRWYPGNRWLLKNTGGVSSPPLG